MVAQVNANKEDPMAFLLVRHKVKDFAKWKRAYDGHAPARRKAALRQKALLRSVRNPKDVLILFQAASLSKAKAFTSSANLRKVMKEAGVVGKPEISFLK
ncbi:MAG TPA: hypothetical protein VLA41_03295 [Burkholderiales bacterium]|nr:hypothetical protein [Burkholderiales bacterium]